ncbi:peptidoglycan-binding domain-containing protein [Desulfosporosinus sp.]|uniref:peptidoglycan-binding domain-containing protein n=1 Tax=Desulfosporosinus sp. TaxID=157907 RepID=UPI00343AF30E
MGSTGEEVIKLLTTLSILKYNPGISDGIFGVKTASAVIQFQKDYGIAPDGIVGPLTWGYLERLIATCKIYINKPGDTFLQNSSCQ